MKRFGVYVKFSNAEEHAQLGGYFENDDNVIARTPAKNRSNLESLKQNIMELVTPKVKYIFFFFCLFFYFILKFLYTI